jgi:hypothetical protein
MRGISSKELGERGRGEKGLSRVGIDRPYQPQVTLYSNYTYFYLEQNEKSNFWFNKKTLDSFEYSRIQDLQIQEPTLHYLALLVQGSRSRAENVLDNPPILSAAPTYLSLSLSPPLYHISIFPTSLGFFSLFVLLVGT